jgi:acetyl-CoA carboxylase carboxyltransferase component/biotin carboxyl carrier protein
MEADNPTAAAVATVAVLLDDAVAVRAARAVRELAGTGRLVRTVALLPEPGRRRLAASVSDHLVEVEGADAPALARALVSCGATHAWTWGAPPAMAEACETAGLAPIGSGAAELRRSVSAATLAGAAASAGLAVGATDGAKAARRVEVTVVEWSDGGIACLGVRDLTVRHRGQVLLAENPAPAVSESVSKELEAAARAIHDVLGLGAITTARFALDGERFVLHGVAPGPGLGWEADEAVWGVDLVRWALARGLDAGDASPTVAPDASPRGHGLVAWIRARDPFAGFAPRRGTVLALTLPSGPGVGADAATAEGDIAGSHELLRVTAWGWDRPEALTRLRRAVGETTVLAPDAPDDRPFLAQVLASADLGEEVIDGELAARVEAVGLPHDRERGAVALLAAAVEEFEADLARVQARFLATAARGRPEVPEGTGLDVELRHRGHRYVLRVRQSGPGQFLVASGAAAIPVRVEEAGPFERRLACGDRTYRVASCASGGRASRFVEVDGERHLVHLATGLVVEAPAPAVVVATRVRPGNRVREGDPLVTVEAMKMEMTIASPAAGVVRTIVPQNTQVSAGALLARLDLEEATGVAEEDPIRLEEFVPSEDHSGDGPAELTARVRELILGYDIDPVEARELPRQWTAMCAKRAPDDPRIPAAEEEALQTFADLMALSDLRFSADDIEREVARAPQEYLLVFLRTMDPSHTSVPPSFADDLRRALAHYGIGALERTPALETALYRMVRSHRLLGLQAPVVLAVLDRRLEHVSTLRREAGAPFRALLDRLVEAAQQRAPEVADLAREVRYRYFDQPVLEETFDRVYEEVERRIAAIIDRPQEDHAADIEALVACPQPIKGMLIRPLMAADEGAASALLETLIRRYYRFRELGPVRFERHGSRLVATADYPHDGTRVHLFAAAARWPDLPDAAATLSATVDSAPEGDDVLTDFFTWHDDPRSDAEATSEAILAALNAAAPARRVRRAVVTMSSPATGLGSARAQHFTYRHGPDGFVEEAVSRGLHPMMGKRLDLWRLSNFRIDRLASAEDVYLFHGVAHENPKDERLFCLAEVRDLTPVRDAEGRVVQLPHLERMLTEALAAIRLYQSHRPPGRRLQWNRVLLYVWPVVDLAIEELFGLIHRLAPLTEGLGLEKVVVRARWRDTDGEVRDRLMHITNPLGHGLSLRFEEPADQPIRPLTPYRQKVVQSRQRGLVYPYEIVSMLAPSGNLPAGEFPPGEFLEHDLDDDGSLVPVERPFGENRANIVVGVIRSFVPAYPEGMARVAVLGDPSRALGSLAEPECRRILAALDLAESMGVPLEWFAVSAGAKISMDSGTENMDWIARVLRRLIEFTQAGGEVNIIVCGINVGAQPYWNAEATMLMHTKGILVMTPSGAMVLTGKQALDYSGGVSAEDNFGIGGYDRVMGPNGQAQYWAAGIGEACGILLRHYEHTYVAPGERFPRRVPSADPVDRDVRTSPHRGEPFATVGEMFSAQANPERKLPFDVRSVMRAVVDADHAPLERWSGMRDAETVVVWDAHLGGYPVCVLGIESKPLPRLGDVDADGPAQWTAGTLFPMSSKKAARAINAARGNRPLVVLANLSGFDGAPESLRRLQLEYGAEIGRAIVNFRGPIVFCVISRYHGGAFVVFSATLNDQIEAAAVEGSYASVIGGAPAAAVVFTRDVDGRVAADPRVAALEERAAAAEGPERAAVRAELERVRREVRSEKLGEVAAEFDAIHDIHRAQRTGSVHHIVAAADLRAYLVGAVERGIARTLAEGR